MTGVLALGGGAGGGVLSPPPPPPPPQPASANSEPRTRLARPRAPNLIRVLRSIPVLMMNQGESSLRRTTLRLQADERGTPREAAAECFEQKELSALQTPI